MKHVFSVPDMSCNHCRMRIEKALDASGKAKTWTVDLPGKTVAVESDSDVAVLAGILSEAGYPPAGV
jgi:copper chaperone